MITIISGAPGAGKSSLNTYFIIREYQENGRILKERCVSKINEINKNRLNPLTPPDKPPIFADYSVKFLVDYDKFFEPFFINGYYLGLTNERMNTQYLPPFSKVFLGEAQRYYNSRRSANFPDHVSRLYEMHRHYGLDIYMDVQRVRLIDPNIRDLCRHFIEVQSMHNTLDKLERIVKSTWYCREFANWTAFEDYLNTGAATFTERCYVYEGNIFDCFDSFGYFDMFLPSEEKDFNYLNFRKRGDNLKPSEEEFYKNGEPIGYRIAPKDTKK